MLPRPLLPRWLWVHIVLLALTGQLLADVMSTTGTLRLDADGDGSPEAVLNASGLGLGTVPTEGLQVQGNGLVSGSLGVGSSSPSSNLEITGTMAMSYLETSSDATVSTHSVVLGDTSTGNITITLPDASNIDGRVVRVKKMSLLNNMSVESEDLIDGRNALYLMEAGDSLPSAEFIAHSGNWLSLDTYGAIGTGISPDDNSLSANLRVWLKDASNRFSAGNWQDASGQGNDMLTVTDALTPSIGGTGSLASLTPSSGLFSGRSLSAVLFPDNSLMRSSNTHASGNYKSLTLFSVLDTTANDFGGDRPVSISSKSAYYDDGGGYDNHDRFAQAMDASLRFDDGAAAGSQTNPVNSLFIRVSRLSDGTVDDKVDDWVDSGAGLVKSIDDVTVPHVAGKGSQSPNFETYDADLFIGETSTIDASDRSTTYNVAQVVLFDTALSEEQILWVVRWLRNHPDGN